MNIHRSINLHIKHLFVEKQLRPALHKLPASITIIGGGGVSVQFGGRSGLQSEMTFKIFSAAILKLVIRLAPKPTLILTRGILPRIPERSLVVALSLGNVIPAITHSEGLNHELGTFVGAFNAPWLLFNCRRYVSGHVFDGTARVVIVFSTLLPT